MSNVKHPKHHQRVMAYLIVDDALMLSDFLKVVFSAEDLEKVIGENEKLVHREYKIGDSTIMLSNTTDEWGPMNAGLFIYVEDADKSYLAALNAGAQAIMPPADQSYGRSCGILDPCGNTWWITSIIE